MRIRLIRGFLSSTSAAGPDKEAEALSEFERVVREVQGPE